MPVQTAINATDYWIRGTDQDFAVLVTQSDGTTPQAMTGWTLAFEVLDAEDSPVVLITNTPTLTSSGTGTDNLATASITDADSEAIKSGYTYWWRLRRTDAGSERVLALGTAFLRGSGL
jgi:ribonucleotide monophosphatase NagD (HAD superfamily)